MIPAIFAAGGLAILRRLLNHNENFGVRNLTAASFIHFVLVNFYFQEATRHRREAIKAMFDSTSKGAAF